jgi:hypothetical protein
VRKDDMKYAPRCHSTSISRGRRVSGATCHCAMRRIVARPLRASSLVSWVHPRARWERRNKLQELSSLALMVLITLLCRADPRRGSGRIRAATKGLLGRPTENLSRVTFRPAAWGLERDMPPETSRTIELQYRTKGCVNVGYLRQKLLANPLPVYLP